MFVLYAEKGLIVKITCLNKMSVHLEMTTIQIATVATVASPAVGAAFRE